MTVPALILASLLMLAALPAFAQLSSHFGAGGSNGLTGIRERTERAVQPQSARPQGDETGPRDKPTT